MGVKVITPADLSAAITVAEMRLNSRASMTDTTEDPLFVRWLASAAGMAEHYTQRSIGSQTLELALDEFPSGPIELPRGPVTAITSITYVDATGATQTLAGSAYMLDDYGLQCWAVPAVSTVWPATYGAANAVKVRYVAGDLHPSVAVALLRAVSFQFENREATEEDVIGFIKTQLDTVKVWGV